MPTLRIAIRAALLQASRFDESETQFGRALERAPNNGWSYYGLCELYKARGNAEAARKLDEKLANTWIGDRALLQLTRL
jgi:tetratricopeptide (TPR) repeat protein